MSGGYSTGGHVFGHSNSFSLTENMPRMCLFPLNIFSIVPFSSYLPEKFSKTPIFFKASSQETRRANLNACKVDFELKLRVSNTQQLWVQWSCNRWCHTTQKGQAHDVLLVVISIVIAVLNMKLPVLRFSSTTVVGFGLPCSF